MLAHNTLVSTDIVALCGEWRGGDPGWSRSLQETLLIVKYCGDKNQ